MRGRWLYFVGVIESHHVSCTCHGESMCKVMTFYACSMLSPKDQSSVVLTAWACCAMAGRNVWQKRLSQSDCRGAPLWDSNKSVKQSCCGCHALWERWSRIRREEKAKEWKGEHEESCLLQLHRWCSRWDGRDGWIRSESKTGKERNGTRPHVWQCT